MKGISYNFQNLSSLNAFKFSFITASSQRDGSQLEILSTGGDDFVYKY
jgi:hypothetical protein